MNLNHLFVTSGQVKVETEIQEWMLIDAYWCEKIEFRGEEKERYKYLDPMSEVRKVYEDVFKEYDLVDSIIKYVDVNYLKEEKLIDDRNVKKEYSGNFQPFWGLRRKIFGKVAVVGSRKYDNRDKLFDELDKIDTIKEIVSGGAAGADILAEEYADERGIKKTIFTPEWASFGKRAGVIRNTTIIDYADIVVAFWDGKSKGTLDVINKCKKRNKRCIVVCS